MARHLAKRVTSATSIPEGTEANLDTNFRPVLVNLTQREPYNYDSEKNSEIAEAKIQRRRPQKEKLVNMNCTRKSFSQPEHGCLQALEQEIVEFLCSKKKS
jgi:hypothetical protein